MSDIEQDNVRALIGLITAGSVGGIAWLFVRSGRLRARHWAYVILPVAAFVGDTAALTFVPTYPFLSWPARLLGSAVIAVLTLFGAWLVITVSGRSWDRWDRKRLP